MISESFTRVHARADQGDEHLARGDGLMLAGWLARDAGLGRCNWSTSHYSSDAHH